MPSQLLQFVAVTSGGRAFDIEFPLHPETRSAKSVSDLVTSLLQAISEHAQRDGDVSDGDILQALAMTSAIRGHMIGADPQQVGGLHHELFDEAWAAVGRADSYPATRA